MTAGSAAAAVGNTMLPSVRPLAFPGGSSSTTAPLARTASTRTKSGPAGSDSFTAPPFMGAPGTVLRYERISSTACIKLSNSNSACPSPYLVRSAGHLVRMRKSPCPGIRLHSYERHERVQQSEQVVEAEHRDAQRRGIARTKSILGRLQPPIAVLVPGKRVGGADRLLDCELLDAAGDIR